MSTAVTKQPAPLSPESSSPRVANGRQLGRYEILCELASGGMASVHIARAQGVAGFERLVAVKVLHPHLAHEEEFIHMFLDEARLAARIRHPNVVATQDISDTEGNGFFLVMDYIEGDHLGSLLSKTARQGKSFSTGICARLLIDSLTGLAAAHDLLDENGALLNIVHRDISPHNILVGMDGVARLTDFGVAKAEVRLSSTRAGQFKGKLSYMAPEQASTGTCDQRSDLFAMGIILWESLTARRLFRGESNAATLSKILVDEIPMPSAVDPALEPWDGVLQKALARDPAMRFQTASEFVEAIEHVAIGHGGIATSRAVATIAKDLLGEKVDAERARVRSAIAENNATGSSGTQPRIPIAGSVTTSAIPMSPTHARMMAARDASISGEHTGQVTFVQEQSRRTSVLLVTALCLVAVAAGIAGYFASRAQPTRIEQVVVPAPPPPEPRAAVNDSVPTPPAADIVTEVPTVTPPGTADVPAESDVATNRARTGSTMRQTNAASSTTTTTSSTTATTTTPPAMDVTVMEAAMVEREIPIENNPYDL